MSFSNLSFAWQEFDLQRFSAAKSLWQHQQEALRCALKALWKYYEDLADYHIQETDAVQAVRKERLWQWYRANGLHQEMDIPLEGQRRDVRDLLKQYYPAENESISYRHFINRMGFWMATGSGKSLVLVKLVELLWQLMQAGEIPSHPILILSTRDDLLKQIETHVQEFNSGRTDFRIVLQDLKSYPDLNHHLFPLVGEHEMTVFFYRADNLSDEQKERIVDFRNYENCGRWYVILDEAHKGDKQDSKRQHIYSILSRNGFLFNFSATFTDPRDIVTTVYNFNLSEFIRAGYGKHIAVLRQENRAFKDKEDYTNSEKQRMVLKALLMLAYVRKVQETLPAEVRAYHRPLMLVLVNSVNTENADLKLFFRELERIGRGDVSAWQQAKQELRQELVGGVDWIFEAEQFHVDERLFDSLTPDELRQLVYNAELPGSLEVLVNPSNRQEMAFKLKTAEYPFALIKIGDISRWLKDELDGYEMLERLENESFFQTLNEKHSPINLLMGSRSFYEGWDSNRPNVMTYINIGTGVEAKKFILQSIGRGVRIEPLPGHRQRLQMLCDTGRLERSTAERLGTWAPALETLFIFGTNRNALQTVIEQLTCVRVSGAEHLQAPPSTPMKRLPVREAVEANPRKFEITPDELEELRHYVEWLGDDRLLLCRYNIGLQELALLRQWLERPERPEIICNTHDTHNGGCRGDMNLLLSHLLAYFKAVPQQVK